MHMSDINYSLQGTFIAVLSILSSLFISVSFLEWNEAILIYS